ncbi:MAG: DUF6017 domain-containing protein [Eubacteriales bacterium]|nr:DUF6017 domain-containing protein [Eubacteriales bacterium]
MEIVHVEKDGNFTWMKNIHLRDRFLSLKAKGLLSVMFSLPKDWDCTITGLAYISKEGISAIRATIKELEAAGYITRERVRNEAGQLKDMKYTIHETPVNREPEEPVPADEPTVPDDASSDQSSDEPDLSALPEPALENPAFYFPTQASPALDQPVEQNRTQLNTDRVNTHVSRRDKQNTDPSIHPSGTAWQYPVPQRQPWDCGPTGVTTPAIDPDESHCLTVAELEQRVRDQIEYDFLVTDSNRQELDEIVSIIVEVLAMHGEGFEVGGLVKPPDLVMKNFLALNSEHLEYVFACLDRTRSNVRNIRQYLRVALYNAPMTMYSSTAAEVRRDFGFSSFRRRPG